MKDTLWKLNDSFPRTGWYPISKEVHSMIRIFILFFLIFFVSGCQKQGVVRPQDVQPFVPVHVEFTGLSKDTSVEREIDKRLFCEDCLFLRAEDISSPYTLIINYDRRMDLKSLGYFVLGAALAPFEAEFTYSLGVQVMENDMVLKEYHYFEQTRENTDSALGRMFNPFHDTNGRSEEMFAELTDRFLGEMLVDKPVPQVVGSR